MTTDGRHAVASAVASELIVSGRSRAWLAAEIGMRPDALTERLSAHADFDVGDLAAVARALDIPVARLVPRSPAR
nr:hypothetical protein [uncultured Microbacterium sp.]